MLYVEKGRFLISYSTLILPPLEAGTRQREMSFGQGQRPAVVKLLMFWGSDSSVSHSMKS